MQAKHKRLTALLLALILMLVTQPVMAEQRLFDEAEHSETHFADMHYSRYDFEGFNKKLDELRLLMDSSGSRDNLLSLFDELLYEADVIMTMSSLITIHYYCNPGDDYWKNERAYTEEALNDSINAFEIEISRLLESDYEDDFIGHIGEYNAEMFRDYEGMSEEQKDFYAENLALELSYYEIIDAYEPYSNEYYNALGENYIKALRVRAQIADSFDYDSFDSFANNAYYYRDYDYRETERLFTSVEKYVLPLYEKLQKKYSSEYMQIVSEYSPPPTDELVELVGKYICDISPELAIPWNYLIRNGLYDLDPSPTKADIGFTISLPMYASSFIMDSPNGGVFDMQTITHEFGHFTQAYYDTTRAIYQTTVLDLCEVHSQGLELLYSHYYPEVYGENYEAFLYEHILSFLRTIIDYSYAAEFEIAAYRLDEPDFEQLKQLGAEIGRRYWPRASKAALGEYWLNFPHIHTSPMYSTSYVVSALAALDLWVQSLVDFQAATDSYLKLVSLQNDYTFREALRKSGLSDVFKSSAIELLSKNISIVLLEGGNPTGVVPGVPQSYARFRPREEKNPAESQGLPKDMDIATTAVITIVIIVVCVVVIVRSRREGIDKEDI